MTISTRHTAYGKVIEPNRIIILSAHPVILVTKTFTSDLFKICKVGDYVTASFRFSGTRRYLTSVRPDPLSIDESAPSWQKRYEPQLRIEANTFAIRYPVLAAKYSPIVSLEPSGEVKVDGSIYIDGEPARITPSSILDPSLFVSAPVAAIVAPKKEKKNGLTWVNGILIKQEDYSLYMAALKVSQNASANLLMVGPSGCGKTSIPEAIAKEQGLGFLRMNCAAVRDPEEWFGYREARDGSTVFVETDFTKAVREGHTIIVLDEFNRVEPWLHNTLMPLLDHARRTTIHNEEIVVGPQTIFVATMNLGGRFTGTFALDAAILNRMLATIHVSYLSKEDEIELLVSRSSINNELAAKITSGVSALREYFTRNEIDVDASTRTSLKIAALMDTGLITLESAFKATILNLIDDETALKGAIDVIKSSF